MLIFWKSLLFTPTFALQFLTGKMAGWRQYQPEATGSGKIKIK